ncbi:glycosyltransferase [Microvirga thermotolerans]|uniref:Glycosyl transferase family 28 n=1 Tax=Microvirga thermotolerans TaxID=2651334 RepID=A0A5P9JUU4_9HYPH|nr:glycosyltransferase [Microvirga thermotolerans]QFU15949.1 glycosyl transferase family 28 [Microvirga thermotolerans]
MSLRVLIAVTHLLGAGHLTRAAALARAFAEAGHDTILVSGGGPALLPPLGRARLVQLPPVRTVGTDFRTLLDEEGVPVTEARMAARRDLLLETLRTFRPQAVMTELFPFGRRVLAPEFDALLEAARALAPRPLVAASVRDILVVPSKPERVEEAHGRLERFYDAVLVHGDPRLVPLEASWPVGERLRAMMYPTGYVDEGGEVAPAGRRDGIVVSGGSSASGLPLYRAALEAAGDIADRPWRILVGRGLPEAEMEALRRAAPAHATVERARPDFRALLAGAELSVSQAGYNTCVDLLRTGVRAVLVPFEAGRETEQRLRAERLQALGRAILVPEAGLSAGTLGDAIRRSLEGPPPPLLELSLDGARRSVAIVERLARAASAAIHRRLDWSPLDRALARAKDRGRSVRFWWRDDDAVAATPSLDRLLALAGRFGAGIALACIPARIEPSLAERLESEERAFALVHGFRHANHAPEGEKKAEFGAHRPPDAMAQEAGQALEQARRLLGARLLPVFVPPWNRIAPGLIPHLPRLGYRVLSTFRDRSSRSTPEGLAIVNTHVDPIDWRGTRSLADPEGLVRTLADAVERRMAGRADPDEPVGFLTHHLVHDEKVWTFCENLLVYLSRNDAIFAPVVEVLPDESRIAANR